MVITEVEKGIKLNTLCILMSTDVNGRQKIEHFKDWYLRT